MFARFFCALFGFCARKFPVKSKTNPGHFFLTKTSIIDIDNIDYINITDILNDGYTDRNIWDYNSENLIKWQLSQIKIKLEV